MADFCGSTTDTRMLRILFDSVWPSNAAVLIHNIIHRSSYCICTARTRSTQKLTQITFHFPMTMTIHATSTHRRRPISTSSEAVHEDNRTSSNKALKTVDRVQTYNSSY